MRKQDDEYIDPEQELNEGYHEMCSFLKLAGESFEKRNPGTFELYRSILSRFPGSAEALNGIGNCYLEGVGTEKNMDNAMRYHRESALAGYNNAMFNYAVDLELTDNRNCLFWYVKSADRGDAEAAWKLYLLFKGEILDFTIDMRKAIYWLKISANRGFAPAELEYSRRLSVGEDIPKDPEAAEKWWKRAEEHMNRPICGGSC